MASTSSSSKGCLPHKEIENAFEGIAPSATSSPLPKVLFDVYDVFINHRGIDVKRTLATTIYNTLRCMGLRAFLDAEELAKGDFFPAAIQGVIRTASLHIAIFSKNYAQSPWCLAELSFMLKTGTTILPIFYHVQPHDLRWVHKGKGIYADAFAQYEKNGRYEPQKLEEWKSALYTISFYSGWELNKLNDDQGRLLKNIVNTVLKVMKKVPLEVAKHPVGLNTVVEDFEKATAQSGENHQNNVKIVGILGMGGCGKTTLAKELYNRKRPFFTRSSFLFDVRDAAARNVLDNLQKKLLEDLLHVRGLTFDSISEGREILASHLISIRVLIVLDDIDHVDQIHALLPAKDSLGWGSLIIVTTRDMDILTYSRISSIYKMVGLDRSHAEQLFCWHAFLQPNSAHGFEHLVEEFINACNGLPLSLKVLGAQLYRKSMYYWESQLHKISRILPDDIKQRLKISYCALDKEEQEIFLDIACFFIGEKISLAIEVWDGSGWSGVHSWETLVNKCLVELDKQNRIRMHDHFRDLGREIAIGHSPGRFWLPAQTMNIEKPEKERRLIRGIMAATTTYTCNDSIPHCTSYYQPPLEECMELIGNSSNRIQRLRSSLGLKLLVIEGDCFNCQFAELSRDLVWLRWFDFQHKKLPQWLSLRNLRVLELHDPRALEELWEPHADPPLQLRELIITRSSVKSNLQSLPSSIRFLKHLKKIALIGDFSDQTFKIGTLPEEFCHLQSLEHLELRYYIMLSSLPTRFGDLSNLQYIDLRFCKELTALPVSFKQLTQLQYLNLSFCEKLKLTRDVFENMTKLEKLSFQACRKLRELPHQITNQAHLRELYLTGTSIKQLPADMQKLGKLEVLMIGSPFLTSLPMSLGNLSCLTRFEISDCPNLRYLPESSERLYCLDRLEIVCSGLESLPEGFRQLDNLRTLEIIDCPIRQLPLANAELPHLEKCKQLNSGDSSMYKSLILLCLRKTQLSRISISKECCPSLETLILSGNEYLMEIKTLPTTLKIMELWNCNMLKSIKGICGLVNLQKLIISACPELDELPSFAYLISLREFKIEVSNKVEKINGLENSKSLETLSVNTFWKEPGIKSLKDMNRLTRLQLVAHNRSALETCIGTIQKWPCEMTIGGRAARDAESIANSLLLPNLTVIKKLTLVKDVPSAFDCGWTLKFPETYLYNAAAIIVCFVIDCFHQDTFFSVKARIVLEKLPPLSTSSMRLREGKWVYMAFFTAGSLFVEHLNKSFVDAIVVSDQPEKYEIKKGMLVTMNKGEECEVLHTLYQLLATSQSLSRL